MRSFYRTFCNSGNFRRIGRIGEAEMAIFEYPYRIADRIGPLEGIDALFFYLDTQVAGNPYVYFSLVGTRFKCKLQQFIRKRGLGGWLIYHSSVYVADAVSDSQTVTAFKVTE